jgi:hypothetical protein
VGLKEEDKDCRFLESTLRFYFDSIILSLQRILHVELCIIIGMSTQLMITQIVLRWLYHLRFCL